jgi:DNA replication protein DnaC
MSANGNEQTTGGSPSGNSLPDSSSTPTPAATPINLSDEELARRFAEKRATLPPYVPPPKANAFERLAETAQRAADRVATPEEIAKAKAREEREARVRYENEMEKRRQSWKRFLEYRGKRYTECRLDTFVAQTEAQQKVLATLTAYGERMGDNFERGAGVVLIGPPGTGKDHLLIGLAMYAIKDHGFYVRWRNGTDLYGELRDLIRSETRSEAMTIKDYTDPHILILSDPIPPFGAISEHQATMLFRIIDARYSACRPTWVTLNAADREDASKRMGPQVVDRLLHGATTLWCNWPSYRR